MNLFLNTDNMALVTDLYQLTMMACYHNESREESLATFEYFLRPQKERHYFVFAGGEQVQEYLEQVHFSPESIHYLKSLAPFKKVDSSFFKFLENFKFQGEVWMVPEGSIVFPNEPLMQVKGNLAEVQLVETYLLATLNFQTMIASKASRIIEAAQGRPVFEFGTRRAHGPQASVLAARASCLVGCAGTSNLLAGYELGVPVIGTAAHSYILSHESEEKAFQSYYDLFQDQTTLLIDTYDTKAGAKKALQVGSELKGVRLDSGDLVQLSKKVRKILDQAGRKEVKIVASNDLNEYRIAELLSKKALIDAFGVGTELVTSKDQPAISGVYKLVEIEEKGKMTPKMKFSSSKISYPGQKQVFRQKKDGIYSEDILGLKGEKLSGKPLLELAMEKGKRVAPPKKLEELQKVHQAEKKRFPDGFLGRNPQSYEINPSKKLQRMMEQIKSKLA